MSDRYWVICAAHETEVVVLGPLFELDHAEWECAQGAEGVGCGNDHFVTAKKPPAGTKLKEPAAYILESSPYRDFYYPWTNHLLGELGHPPQWEQDAAGHWSFIPKPVPYTLPHGKWHSAQYHYGIDD